MGALLTTSLTTSLTTVAAAATPHQHLDVSLEALVRDMRAGDSIRCTTTRAHAWFVVEFNVAEAVVPSAEADVDARPPRPRSTRHALLHAEGLRSLGGLLDELNRAHVQRFLDEDRSTAIRSLRRRRQTSPRTRASESSPASSVCSCGRRSSSDDDGADNGAAEGRQDRARSRSPLPLSRTISHRIEEWLQQVDAEREQVRLPSTTTPFVLTFEVRLDHLFGSVA